MGSASAQLLGEKVIESAFERFLRQVRPVLHEQGEALPIVSQSQKYSRVLEPPTQTQRHDLMLRQVLRRDR